MRPSAPIPYTDRDPYALPREITSIQAQLKSLGWNREWVEQITDRIMKKQLRTTSARTTEVIEYLQSLGLQQDEICNMAFISIPLLGLSPQKQLQPVVEYLTTRGVPKDAVAGLVFKHPKLFEYRPTEDGDEMSRKSTDFRARVRVDVVPLPDGSKAANVSYYRTGTAFTSSPISPWSPPPQ